MSFDKTVDVRLFGVTNQASSVRMAIGDSVGGTFTSLGMNPMRGTMLWDHTLYVIHGISVNGGATGGSFSIYLETDALAGYTGLPICGVSIGPNTTVATVFTNMHQSSASPIPTHLNIIQHAGGTTGGASLRVHGIARQYRGTLGTPGALNSERVIQGNMIRVGTNSASATFAVGTSASTLGMHRMRLWDRALFWAVAGNSLSGTHDFTLVGRASASGLTFQVARTGPATGVVAVAGAKRALSNLHFGAIPNPTHILWQVVSAGGISDCRIVALVKSGRGSMGKA